MLSTLLPVCETEPNGGSAKLSHIAERVGGGEGERGEGERRSRGEEERGGRKRGGEGERGRGERERKRQKKVERNEWVRRE